MKKLLLVSLLGLTSNLFAPSLWALCKEAGPEEFTRMTSGKVHLVFFASWCKGCAEHLTEAYAKDSVFVTSFDEGATADKIVQRFLGGKSSDVPCVIDKSQRLSQQYGVKYLPFVVNL